MCAAIARSSVKIGATSPGANAGQADQPGLEVAVDHVLRTGPLLHADARCVSSDAAVQIEIPHLHHDTHEVVPGARLHLRLLQFSVYPSAAAAQPTTGHDAIGVAATRRRSAAG